MSAEVQHRVRVGPRVAAEIVSVCILVVAAGVIALLQSFTVSDTACDGTIRRLVDGGPFTNPDGVCAHGESVRFGVSVLIAVLGGSLAWFMFARTQRRAREDASGRGPMPVLVGFVALALFVAALALAFVPVRVPRVGDSSEFWCSPFDRDPTGVCGDRARVRGVGAVAAGVGAAAFGVMWVVSVARAAERPPWHQQDWADPWDEQVEPTPSLGNNARRGPGRRRAE